MANTKGNRVKITLACTECKQRNYDGYKNKKNTTDRLELNKYCRFCKKTHRAQGSQIILIGQPCAN